MHSACISWKIYARLNAVICPFLTFLGAICSSPFFCAIWIRFVVWTRLYHRTLSIVYSSQCYLLFENNDLSWLQAVTATADATNPAKYLTISSWWKKGNSLSQFRSSARISSSLDILSLSLSKDLTLRQNLWGDIQGMDTFMWANISGCFTHSMSKIDSHQLLSPAPRPGTKTSITASTILSTMTAGFIW